VPELDDSLNYEADVNEHRKARKGGRITGAEVVHGNSRHWKGYADAGAQLELAVARVTQAHNNSATSGNEVKEATVKRAFQRIHGGWKEYRSALPKAEKPPVVASKDGAHGITQLPIISLTDNRPVGGRTFGGVGS
jgi:hypothetical protein